MFGLNWGATASERALIMPCDVLMRGRYVRADRAITIDAPSTIVFAWLCQLRVAPYSYDLLDNFGRRSPRVRDPELAHLAVGQRFMTVFTLQSFVLGEQITLRTKRVAVTYAVRPHGIGTRLHVRVLFDGPQFIGRIAAVGDLVMMRKQLHTLKALAEREAAQAPRAQRTEVAAEDSLLVRDYDYADAFQIELPQTDTRSPEQLFRQAVDGRSLMLRWVPLVHQRVLRFRLWPASSANHIFGWRIVTSEPDVIRIEADGPLMRGVIVGRRDFPSTAVLTTFVFYVRRTPARVIWALVGPLHRRVAPYLLERAAPRREYGC